MPEKMVKVKVIVNSLSLADAVYAKGDVFECPEAEARGMLKDKNVALAHADEPISAPIPRVIDPLDQALRDREFEKAKDEAAKAGIKTPDAANDPKAPIPAATLPSGVKAEPIGEIKPPGTPGR